MSAQTVGAQPAVTNVPRSDEGQTGGRQRSAWLFIAPFGFFYVCFLLGPSLYMFVASFFDTSIVKTGLGNFIGLDNYSALVQSKDFWSSSSP